MKLCIYQGLDTERVPKDVTHVIVDRSVTVIRKGAFYKCRHLVCVIMGDSVKRIEYDAFFGCCALRFVRLSRTLEHVGRSAFSCCESLEALFLPSAVTTIGEGAFWACLSLKLLILPHDIDLDNVGEEIINGTTIRSIARYAGVEYERDEDDDDLIAERIRQVNEWLFHHMDEWSFHKLCYTSSITGKEIVDYLTENGKDSALQIDTIHGMTPLHMLSMNPNAPADAIASLFNSNMEAIFCVDNQQKTPLHYARDYNVGGLVEIINGLCSHRNSSIVVVEGDEKRKLED